MLSNTFRELPVRIPLALAMVINLAAGPATLSAQQQQPLSLILRFALTLVSLLSMWW